MALSIKELERLFIEADDAGNEDDARAFLAEIDRLNAAMVSNRADFNTGKGQFTPYSPTEGQRGTDLRVEGFGRSLNSTWQGAKQLTGFATQEEIDRQAEIDAPLMNDTNGQIGNIAGMTSQMLIPGTAAVRGGMLAPKLESMHWLARAGVGLTGAAAENAAFTGLQPVVSGDTRGGNMGKAALWGAGGKAAQSGLGLLARGGSGVVSKYMKDLQEEATRRGITFGLGELSNNPMAQTVSNQLGRLPFGGGSARIAENNTAINRGVAKTFGEDADAVTSDVYAAAKNRLSGNYDKIKANNPLPLSKNLMDELSELQQNAQMKGGRESGEIINGWIKSVVSKANKSGEIDGAAFKALDSEMGTMMKAGGPNSVWLGQLRDSLRKNWNDAVIARGNASDIKLLAETNSQYGALKTIRDLVSKNPGEGIAPQGLMQMLNKNDAAKERMAMGTAGELGELAKIGQRLKPPPNSGTADRQLVNTLLSGASGAGGYYAGSQGWISPELAAVVGFGLLGSRVANSKMGSKYFANGLSPAKKGLLDFVAHPLPYVAPAIASTSAAAEEKKKKKKKS